MIIWWCARHTHMQTHTINTDMETLTTYNHRHTCIQMDTDALWTQRVYGRFSQSLYNEWWSWSVSHSYLISKSSSSLSFSPWCCCTLSLFVSPCFSSISLSLSLLLSAWLEIRMNNSLHCRMAGCYESGLLLTVFGLGGQRNTHIQTPCKDIDIFIFRTDIVHKHANIHTDTTGLFLGDRGDVSPQLLINMKWSCNLKYTVYCI